VDDLDQFSDLDFRAGRRLGEEWGTAQSNWHARKVRVCKASQKHRINCSFMKLTAQTVKQCICCWFRMICA